VLEANMHAWFCYARFKDSHPRTIHVYLFP